MLSALTISLALGYSQYTDPKGSTPEPHFRVGVEQGPLYAFGQYEETKMRILGQPIGDSSITSFGVGARKSWGPVFGYFEVGYGMIDENPKLSVQQEVVYTELVGRHNVYMRPVPVDVPEPYVTDTYQTDWEVSDGLLGAIGVGYHLSDKVSVSGAYRPFYVKEHIELKSGPEAQGWWQETRSRNMSSFELRVSYTF